MKPDYSFERQLENLEREAYQIASFVYAEMSIHYAHGNSAQLRKRMNETQILAGMQCSSSIGRLHRTGPL